MTTDDITERTDSNNIITGTCGDNVNFSLNKDTEELEIYGSGNMTDYIAYKSPFYNSKIKNYFSSYQRRRYLHR